MPIQMTGKEISEGDTTLFEALHAFMPSGIAGEPGGMVFNMAYGIQGECRYTHVPAMLEMAGVPYTGSSPMGHALALDKVITKKLMIAAEFPLHDMPSCGVTVAFTSRTEICFGRETGRKVGWLTWQKAQALFKGENFTAIPRVSKGNLSQ
jgi:hypothetical protein